jgi:hypothetical protein
MEHFLLGDLYFQYTLFKTDAGAETQWMILLYCILIILYNPPASPYTCYPLYVHVRLHCCPGLLTSSYPVVILPSLDHVTDGRFIAAHPLPVPLFPWVPFPFPLASPLSLARFLPYFPSKYTSLVFFFLSLKTSKHLTDYESILFGPRLLYSC